MGGVRDIVVFILSKLIVKRCLTQIIITATLNGMTWPAVQLPDICAKNHPKVIIFRILYSKKLSI
jgi:hypothetical protein